MNLISSRVSNLSCVRESRNLLVLGGTGFIGKWLVASFATMFSELKKDALVYVATRDKRLAINSISNLSPEVQLKVQPITYEELFTSKNLLMNVSGYFHCATPTSYFDSEARKIVATTKKLLEKISTYSQNGRKPIFIHLSSGAVYRSETSSDVALETSFPTRDLSSCLNVYQEVKVSLESLTNEFTSAGTVYGCNPRLFAFTGPKLPLTSHFAIADFMRSGIQGLPINIRGHFNTTRSYLHPVDLVIMLIRLMQETYQGNLYSVNIGSEEPITILDLAKLVSRMFKDCTVIDVSDKRAKPTFYIPDMKYSNSILMHQKIFNLEEALKNWRADIAKTT